MPLEESVTAEQFAAVPEQHKDWYRQDGDKYVLDVVPRKINNGTLEAKRKAEQEAAKLRASQEDPELAEARQYLADKRAKEAEETAKKPEIEGALARERAKLKAQSDKEKAELEAKLSESTRREAKYVRDEALTSAALEAGVLKDAIGDVLLLGSSQLTVKDGELVDNDGTEVDPAKWLKGVLSKRKHWLGASTGGGTQKGSGGTSGRKFSDLSAKEKGELLQEIGPREFAKRARQK